MQTSEVNFINYNTCDAMTRKLPLEQLYPGGPHSSMVSSAPTILRPWVRIPSTPSMLFQFVIDLWCGKDENKRKRGRDWPIFNKKLYPCPWGSWAFLTPIKTFRVGFGYIKIHDRIGPRPWTRDHRVWSRNEHRWHWTLPLKVFFRWKDIFSVLKVWRAFEREREGTE